MAGPKDYEDIPGTYVFDADRSREGYHLNMFCISLKEADGRASFKSDPEAYLAKYPMSKEQLQAVKDRAWNTMLSLGGNIYYTAKLAAFDGITFQELAAIMSNMKSEDYRQMMLDGGRSIEGNRFKSEWEQK